MDVDNDDVQLLLIERLNELTTEEHIDLQNEEIKVLQVEHSTEDEQVHEIRRVASGVT